MAHPLFTDYGYERTVWANMQLSKLCPGKNLMKFEDIMNIEDTEQQLNVMMDIIQIMNKAHERKAKFYDPNHVEKLVDREELLNLDEQILGNLTLTALGQFQEDGKVTVEAEPKKDEAEETRSPSTTAGSSSSAISLT